MHPEAETRIDGYAWRILLGPSHEWPVISPERSLEAQQAPAIERCELCREPINTGKPFTTNSAGQQPIHISCLRGDYQADPINSFSKLGIWKIWLLGLLGITNRPTFAPAHND